MADIGGGIAGVVQGWDARAFACPLLQGEGYVPNTAQRRLAEEVTRFVHGEEGLQQAIKATQVGGVYVYTNGQGCVALVGELQA